MAAITIIATAGGDTSNSYITREDAQSYFDGRLYSDAWNDAAENDQNKALVSATLRLDQEVWKGVPTVAVAEQALQWPRTGVIDRTADSARDTWGASFTPYLANDTIPVWLQYATCELALVLLSENRLEDTGLELIEQVGVGDLNVTPRKKSAGQLPAHCRRFCAPYLLYGSGGMVPLVRS